MRISGTGRAGGASSASGSKGTGSSGAVFRPDVPRETAPAAQPRVTQALGGVDALLAIQGAADKDGKKRRAIKRGNDMLDLLDEVKLDLLAGRISQVKLDRLAQAVRAQAAVAEDPRLADILAEIDLRARVELAKLGIDPA